MNGNTTQAEFVNVKALQKIEQELKHERTWGWMRSGHHHRMMILQSQIDMVQGRMALLGEGARKRRQK